MALQAIVIKIATKNFGKIKETEIGIFEMTKVLIIPNKNVLFEVDTQEYYILLLNKK